MNEEQLNNNMMNQQQELTDIGLVPRAQPDMNNVWLKHLDTDEILRLLENMLKGFEYDDEEDEWKPAMIKVLNDQKKVIEVEEGPLMDPKEVRVLVTWLRTHLNSNTFLSKLSEEMINNIMFDANLKLAKMFYRLRRKLTPDVRDMLWGMVENSMYVGLNRAGEGKKGMTLDAVAASHTTIEHLHNKPNMDKKEENKQFKVLGW